MDRMNKLLPQNEQDLTMGKSRIFECHQQYCNHQQNKEQQQYHRVSIRRTVYTMQCG